MGNCRPVFVSGLSRPQFPRPRSGARRKLFHEVKAPAIVPSPLRRRFTGACCPVDWGLPLLILLPKSFALTRNCLARSTYLASLKPFRLGKVICRAADGSGEATAKPLVCDSARILLVARSTKRCKATCARLAVDPSLA